MNPKKETIAPKNPDAFAGQAGCVYFNPAPGRSNELKRDRNADIPYGACSPEEKATRILRLLPIQLVSDSKLKQLNEERAALNPDLPPLTMDEAVKNARDSLLSGLNLTAEQWSAAQAAASPVAPAAPAVAASPAPAASTEKKGRN